ncbi:hypothetical protein PUNSTDRAFT_107687 [Punctularia strigosozonata HHB-11173 SS5]|uniref:Uncharacterized protein n=1 Tax=Punctularia strigosozonata (strain HHB-11173) TaxID=741275 RepID=R7S4P6_PUNST|nr:uncharacterized protein PUNSTDRAFT_107687 [Punctularia strigosozonata HHB-11173 SS5]EIN04844.1 hypothetical protein PUNSTDRAFT_107687 [Punctularia strigosozonata HHB-11173 SS5]
MSNNPFIEQPAFGASSQASFSRRFPDIDVPQSTAQPQYQQQYASPTGSWQQVPSSPYGQSFQQTPSQPYGLPQQYPQPTGISGFNGGFNAGYALPTPSIQTPAAFQPSTSFGQQISSPATGMSYVQPQQQLPQYGAYPNLQQQQQPGPAGYNPMQQVISEFDPYANAGEFLGSVSNPQPGSSGAIQSTSTPGHQRSISSGAPGGYKHPREYVREHKSELEGWDAYSWKQAMNAFDALKEAWAQRKRDAESRVNQLAGPGAYWDYARQQESARLQGIAKEAEINYDSVAASAFQMQEVFSGYRQSSDMASKRRVKESINAALSSLPDWPNPQW